MNSAPSAPDCRPRGWASCHRWSGAVCARWSWSAVTSACSRSCENSTGFPSRCTDRIQYGAGSGTGFTPQLYGHTVSPMARAIKGRGALSQPPGRFDKLTKTLEHDGWYEEEIASKVETVVQAEPARSIISRNQSPDIGFSQSINPYRGCAHGCIYCASGDMLILTGNGRTLPLSEVRVGDEIYGTRRVGGYRRYTKSRVLAHWSSIKPAFRTTLEDGTTLVTSGDHRFLSDRGWK